MSWELRIIEEAQDEQAIPAMGLGTGKAGKVLPGPQVDRKNKTCQKRICTAAGAY